MRRACPCRSATMPSGRPSGDGEHVTDPGHAFDRGAGARGRQASPGDRGDKGGVQLEAHQPKCQFRRSSGSARPARRGRETDRAAIAMVSTTSGTILESRATNNPPGDHGAAGARSRAMPLWASSHPSTRGVRLPVRHSRQGARHQQSQPLGVYRSWPILQQPGMICRQVALTNARRGGRAAPTAR
jgi:hypothetical protein